MMRFMMRLSSGLPGTITVPFLRSAKAPSRMSSLRSAMRLPLSGPWQRKQLSERMGRTCRWKSGPPAEGAGVVAEGGAEAAEASSENVSADSEAKSVGRVVHIVFLNRWYLAAPDELTKS